MLERRMNRSIWVHVAEYKRFKKAIIDLVDAFVLEEASSDDAGRPDNHQVVSLLSILQLVPAIST